MDKNHMPTSAVKAKSKSLDKNKEHFWGHYDVLALRLHPSCSRAVYIKVAQRRLAQHHVVGWGFKEKYTYLAFAQLST